MMTLFSTITSIAFLALQAQIQQVMREQGRARLQVRRVQIQHRGTSSVRAIYVGTHVMLKDHDVGRSAAIDRRAAHVVAEAWSTSTREPMRMLESCIKRP
ncbi:hypothetical protein TB1_031488 [Malus domestica]